MVSKTFCSYINSNERSLKVHQVKPSMMNREQLERHCDPQFACGSRSLLSMNVEHQNTGRTVLDFSVHSLVLVEQRQIRGRNTRSFGRFLRVERQYHVVMESALLATTERKEASL